MVILVVPRVLKMIFDFLWDGMVLKGLKSSKARVICLRRLWLSSTESFCNGIQICNGVSVIVTTTKPTRRWLLATFLITPSSRQLLLSSSHSLGR